MVLGAVTPNLMVLYDFRHAILSTVTFAFCGISLGICLGTVFAFLFRYNVVRLFCAFIRAIHEIFWAFILLPVVGLNPICGILAIGIPYSGIFGKVYAEIIQEANQRPLQGLPAKTNRISKILYGVLPVIYEDIKNYTSYRFESALRSSAVLGFIGLPTLGFHLEIAFREGMYSEVSALLYGFYLIIASLRFWVKPRFVIGYLAGSIILISKEISLSLENALRFFTHEILPWPMRKNGILDGTNELSFEFQELWEWAAGLFATDGLEGLWQTTVLTQIVLATTGILTLLSFPAISHHFIRTRLWRQLGHLILIVCRTTPEYILAYVFVQLLGPSMLPAIIAITLHNFAILSFLTGGNANLLKLRADAPRKRINCYLYEVLPRVYSQFQAFLFYRWEVMMRESAILGLLGIYTLGFFVDSSISDAQMDKAMFLIILTACLNMGIDSISQLVRKRLKVSIKLTTAC